MPPLVSLLSLARSTAKKKSLSIFSPPPRDCQNGERKCLLLLTCEWDELSLRAWVGRNMIIRFDVSLPYMRGRTYVSCPRTTKGLSTLAPGIGNRSQNQSQKLLFKNAFAGKKHFKCVSWLLVERVNISENPLQWLVFHEPLLQKAFSWKSSSNNQSG